MGYLIQHQPTKRDLMISTQNAVRFEFAQKFPDHTGIMASTMPAWLAPGRKVNRSEGGRIVEYSVVKVTGRTAVLIGEKGQRFSSGVEELRPVLAATDAGRRLTHHELLTELLAARPSRTVVDKHAPGEWQQYSIGSFVTVQVAGGRGNEFLITAVGECGSSVRGHWMWSPQEIGELTRGFDADARDPLKVSFHKLCCLGWAGCRLQVASRRLQVVDLANKFSRVFCSCASARRKLKLK